MCVLNNRAWGPWGAGGCLVHDVGRELRAHESRQQGVRDDCHTYSSVTVVTYIHSTTGMPIVVKLTQEASMRTPAL